MVLYALLYIFILAVIYQKIRQGKKVHPIWFLVLLILTTVPVILLFFTAGTATEKTESVLLEEYAHFESIGH
jgi:hypothetical protein